MATKKDPDERFPERNSPVIEALAFNVKRLRKAKHLTQVQFAKAVGIDQPTLSLLESGRANPTLLVVERIATLLDIDVRDLLRRKPHVTAKTK